MNIFIEKIKGYLPYIVGLIIFSCIIFYPELQGKKLGSHDSVGWYGAAKEFLIYHEKGENIKWTNRVFAGMPLYTIGGEFYGNLLMKIYYKSAEIFPDQILNFSIVSLCIFLGSILLGIRRRIALILSFLFCLNTWIIDSMVASHSSKILSIGFTYLLISGIYGFYIRSNVKGLIAIGIGLLMLIGMNHYQIVYYSAICIVLIMFHIAYQYFMDKKIKNFVLKSIPVLVLVLLALLSNYSNIWITNDYSKDTMRGGKTELLKLEANSTSEKGGLDINYAFSWSYTPSELFNFIVPNAKGGASNFTVKPGKSKLAEAIGQDKIPLYWGEQPFTGAPNYIGAALFFLVIFTFYYWKNSLRWPFLAIIILFSIMGLGRFFLEFNQILFENLPLYNKFRTPTMSFSMVNLSFIILGGMGLNHLITEHNNTTEAIKALKYSLYTMMGIMIIGYLAISSGGYTSSADAQIFAQNPQLLQTIIEDRESFFKSDFFRSLFIMLAAAGIIWGYIMQKIEQKWFIIILGILAVGELYFVSDRFYDREAFQKTEKIEDLIPNEPYNQYMAGDTSYFRMFNTTTSTFNDNTDGYRYSNIGGYSPAKLYRYQDLIDVHLSKMNMNVLNMLNTKYFVIDQNGQKTVQTNPEAYGNSWFVKEVKFAKNANAEIDSIGTSNAKQTAWVDIRYQKEGNFAANTDTNASISLTKYHPERMEYASSSSTGGFAVFSEIWYRGNEDWKIYVDGKPTKMIRTDYLLRGAFIPSGSHKIEMRYTQEKLDFLRTLGQLASLLLIIVVITIPYIEGRLRKRITTISP